MEKDLTLDRASEIARCTEAAIADARVIADCDTKEAAVQLQKKACEPKHKAIQTTDATCIYYCCGSADHLANNKFCPAKDCKYKTWGNGTFF